ncbi:MAG: replicative DNA helicase [Armatimonadetes bacterium]|nr:replicative DNA helicase [Armatimonadota bacterium]MBS1711844.1 replicative DNA helicase [Armatimonadota bacterium]MBX3109602.1 replicative DNA helicase [Fimbriimonadaceae bacterium]
MSVKSRFSTMDDFVPPQSTEAEMSALGAMLLSEKAAMEVVETVSEEDFYVPAHREIFKAAYQLMRNSKAIDLVTLRDELTVRGKLEQVGGIEYLVQIAETVPSASNAAYYAGIVQDKSTLRNLEEAGHEIVKIARESEHSADEKVDLAESKVFEVGRKRMGKYFESVRSLAKEFFIDVDELFEGGEPALGTLTGYTDLDRVTTGFYGGDLVIVASRPAMGKTSLVMNFAINVARAEEGAVAVFNLEMSGKQLARRMIATLAQVPMGALKQANLHPNDYQKLADACEDMYNLPIYIDDTSDVSPLEMRGKCRRLKAEHGLSLVIVDYLQLMRGSGKRNENRTQEIGEIARSLKVLAKELDVPVIALSQLNRGVESRDDKRPMLADIRESGSIEADADMVMFIYRNEYYQRKEAGKEHEFNPHSAEVAELIIGKHRNGPTGTVLLGFQPAYTRFTLLDEQSKEEYQRNLRKQPNDD